MSDAEFWNRLYERTHAPHQNWRQEVIGADADGYVIERCPIECYLYRSLEPAENGPTMVRKIR